MQKSTKFYFDDMEREGEGCSVTSIRSSSGPLRRRVVGSCFLEGDKNVNAYECKDCIKT